MTGPAEPGAPAGQVPHLPTVPAEITREWWSRHRHLCRWSFSQRALESGWRLAAGDWRMSRPTPGAPCEPAEGLEGFIGQQRTVKSLSVEVRAARRSGEMPAPILLSGPPGLGKTTLARLAALELGGRLHVTEGPSLKDPLILLGLLASLRKGDV